MVHSVGGRDAPMVIARHALRVEAADAAVIAQLSDLTRAREHGAWVASSVANSRVEMASLGHALAVRLGSQVIILCVVVDTISTAGAMVGLRLAVWGDTATQTLNSVVEAVPGHHVAQGVVDSVH